MSDLVKLGALWLGKDKDGKTMMTGLLGDARLMVLRNGYKKEEKHPDFILYVAPSEKKEKKPVQESNEFDDLPF